MYLLVLLIATVFTNIAESTHISCVNQSVNPVASEIGLYIRSCLQISN